MGETARLAVTVIDGSDTTVSRGGPWAVKAVGPARPRPRSKPRRVCMGTWGGWGGNTHMLTFGIGIYTRDRTARVFWAELQIFRGRSDRIEERPYRVCG